jgi:hypothetical protein
MNPRPFLRRVMPGSEQSIRLSLAMPRRVPGFGCQLTRPPDSLWREDLFPSTRQWVSGDWNVGMRPGTISARERKGGGVSFILWIIAVALVVWGIVNLVRGAVLAGILLIIAGLLVGPGGVSIFG